jgi:hypothetical protein
MNLQVIIYNALGMEAINFFSNENESSVNTLEWEPGLYFAQLHSDIGILTYKLLKF